MNTNYDVLPRESFESSQKEPDDIKYVNKGKGLK